MATDLSPFELTILRYYFTGSLAGDLVVAPDEVISWAGTVAAAGPSCGQVDRPTGPRGQASFCRTAMTVRTS
ncbi:hypothetical protein CLV30_101134 [Haloactinopolyspora alba]|uniref:Uncharacterized protein n=1 Tax=Haloactinopolyspora alba TaxID=648780 RepID=A0A2P8EFC1_9ACTN|nr:hypothetical protein [Haloactinopolyspora alba]PSL08167.1 hypothetical protein CLV30_101134 [Haloactinopolyspora alba]